MRRRKILIIDDNERDKSTMESNLKRAGYQNVMVSHEEMEQVQFFEKHRPDVVILDTVLDGNCGFKLCERIKKNKDHLTQVIMTTGHIDLMDAKAARRAGADDFVAKTKDCLPILNALSDHKPSH